MSRLPRPEHYAHAPHVRRADGEVLAYEGVVVDDRLSDGAEDVIRDMARRGYFTADDPSGPFGGRRLSPSRADQVEILDDSARATVVLEFTATDAGATVPAGTQIMDDVDGEALGAVVFETAAELVLAPSATATVSATALHPGRVYNVRAGELVHQESPIVGVEAVTNPSAASGGLDHQLTRLHIYRVLELIYLDLYRIEDDGLHVRMREFGRRYMEELDRMQGAGILLDFDGDGELDDDEELEKHGYINLERG